MPINFFPALAYVLVATFTPGPATISTASLAVQHGYRQTLTFQGGLAVGVFCIMLASGMVTSALLGIFPMLEPVLRYAGAAYILYLAYTILKATYNFADQPVKAVGFVRGFLLQFLNFKLFVYAITLFSTFLAPIGGSVGLLVVTAVLLALVSLCATSLWAAFGSAVKLFLRAPRAKAVVNILLALSLVYTAIALAGLI